MTALESDEQFRNVGDFEEIWKELLRCSMCKERIAIVSVKKTSGEGSLFGAAVCVKCLPKFVEQIILGTNEKMLLT